MKVKERTSQTLLLIEAVTLLRADHAPAQLSFIVRRALNKGRLQQ